MDGVSTGEGTERSKAPRVCPSPCDRWGSPPSGATASAVGRLDKHPMEETTNLMDDGGGLGGLLVASLVSVVASEPAIPADGPRRGGFGFDLSKLIGQRFDLFLYLTSAG